MVINLILPSNVFNSSFPHLGVFNDFLCCNNTEIMHEECEVSKKVKVTKICRKQRLKKPSHAAGRADWHFIAAFLSIAEPDALY